MWRNRVLAAALAVQAGLVKDKTTDELMDDRQDSEAFQFFLTMPGEMLGNIFYFAGTPSLRLFSATCKQSKNMIRRTPQTSGMWRRNVFYAKCGHLPTEGGHLANWDWKILCAEDRPDMRVLPIPRDLAFFSPTSEQVEGGLHDPWADGSKLSCNAVKTLKGSSAIGWVPHFSTGAIQFRDGVFTFFTNKSPFPSSSKNPAVVKGFVRGDRRKCFVAIAGHDKYGGFIGAGVGDVEDAEARLQNLTICCRYLSPNDERMAWPIDKILNTLNLRNSPRPHPWRNTLFNHEYVVNPAALTFSKYRIAAVPGFELKLSVFCNLRGCAAKFLADDLPFSVSNDCCSLYGCLKSIDKFTAVKYENEDVLGLQEFLYELNENRVAFCNNGCFFEWMTDHDPLFCHSNIIWKEQCWGCGSVDLDGYVYKLHLEVDAGGDEYEGEKFAKGLFGDHTARFCCGRCARGAMPKVLKLCRDRQEHDFTSSIADLPRGRRDLLMNFGEALYNEVLYQDEEFLQIMEREGWKRLPCEPGWLVPWQLNDPNRSSMNG